MIKKTRNLLQIIGRKPLLDKLLLILAGFYISMLSAACFIESLDLVNCFLIFVIFLINGLQYFLYFRQKTNTLVGYCLAILEYILLVAVFYQSQSNIESVLLIIYTAKIAVFHRLLFSLPFCMIGYGVYLVMFDGYPSQLLSMLFNTFSFALFLAAVASFKVILNQKETIDQLNKRIIEQSSAMEEMARLKERNRIAEEVHNSIGHTLTTAIISLEGANLLFERKPQEALEKLSIAKEQLKNGLYNVREVVRAMRTNQSLHGDSSIKTMVDELIRNVQAQTSVEVRFNYQVQHRLLSLQNFVLYNTIKESITNALKHGQATLIEISISEQKGIIEGFIRDNGSGCKILKEGFGLTAINSNLHAIGGTLKYQIGDHGFLVSFRIPLVGVDEHATH